MALRTSAAAALLGLAALALPAAAEPWLAVAEGLACGACHVNPSGAGLRTPFGNAYAQRQLPAQALPADAAPWSGVVGDRFHFGANARASARQAEFDDRDDALEFGVDRATLYLGADLGDHAAFYLDQQVAPGGALNREAWAQLRSGAWYLKAGRLFLPFGWRLEDDTALVREVTGISLTQGDDGVELGLERPGLSWQLAAVNGNGGGPEIDDGKLFTTRLAVLRPAWRLGVSALHNDTDRGDRAALGIFAGLRTGPVAWLAELDVVDDDGAADDDRQEVALLEANVAVRQGHNLKLSAEAHRLDGRDDRYRLSAVYEYFPWAFAQLRVGVRARISDADVPADDAEEAFVQLHLFF